MKNKGNSDKESIGSRLKIVREELKKSQEAFAEGLGMSSSAISAYETSRRPLPDRIINLICNEYKVNKDYIKFGTGEVFDTEVSRILGDLEKCFKLDKSDMEVIKGLINAPPQFRNYIKKFIIEVANTDALKKI